MKKLLNEKGSTLVLVVVMFAVAVILCTAALTATMSANMVSSENVKQKQAYFTARSAVNATVKVILNYQESHPNINDIDAFMANLIGNTGNGSVPGLGDYKVSITKLPDGKDVDGNPIPRIKVLASATYNGLSATVSENMYEATTTTVITKSSVTDATNPFENLVTFTDGSKQHKIIGASLEGNMFYNGSVYISQGGSYNDTNAKGRIFATGDIEINDRSLGINPVVSQGNIYLYRNAEIMPADNSGNLYCDKNLDTTYDYSRKIIHGNVYVNGDVNLYNTIVYGNITCVGNVSMNDSYVTGTITAGGNIYGAGWNTKTTSHASVAKTDIKADSPSDYNTDIPLPSYPDDIPVSDSSYGTGVISSSGTLSSSFINRYNQVIVDTGQTVNPNNDIYLIIDKTININNCNILLKGVNHLIICLEGDAQLTLNGSSSIGMYSENGDEPVTRVAIIGNGYQGIIQKGYSTINAAVYLPKGFFYGNYSDYPFYYPYSYTKRFVGSLVCYDVNVYPNSNRLVFSKCDITNTPLYNYFSTITTTKETLKAHVWEQEDNSWGNS